MEDETQEVTVALILAARPSEPGLREPAVSEADRRVHGDLAGAVVALREARDLASAAHALACRRRRRHPVKEGDCVNRVQVEALDQAVERTWKAEAGARLALQEVAAVTPQLLRGT